jgi:hypothetical protein
MLNIHIVLAAVFYSFNKVIGLYPVDSKFLQFTLLYMVKCRLHFVKIQIRSLMQNLLFKTLFKFEQLIFHGPFDS